MNTEELRKTAKAMASPRKGILATDATDKTMDKRMASVGITPNAELRRKFREVLLTTEGISEFIDGVILNDEIIRQNVGSGMAFPDLLVQNGILTGIKVDGGAKDMANFPGEKITEGLDGLRDRLVEYKKLGAKFTKWRAVITIGKGIPTDTCIKSNAEALARYVALAQEAGMVPIVEPEVLMDGSHGIAKCEEVTKRTLNEVFKKLSDHKVYLPGILLKPNLIHPGKESGEEVNNEDIAKRTIKVLKEYVPDEVPGVVFLSGGDAAPEMTSHLDYINELGPHPWEVSFSFERALEGPALEIWAGKDENAKAAQDEFYKRARFNSLARTGAYEEEMEKGEQ